MRVVYFEKTIEPHPAFANAKSVHERCWYVPDMQVMFIHDSEGYTIYEKLFTHEGEKINKGEIPEQERRSYTNIVYGDIPDDKITELIELTRKKRELTEKINENAFNLENLVKEDTEPKAS